MASTNIVTIATRIECTRTITSLGALVCSKRCDLVWATLLHPPQSDLFFTCNKHILAATTYVEDLSLLSSIFVKKLNSSRWKEAIKGARYVTPYPYFFKYQRLSLVASMFLQNSNTQVLVGTIIPASDL